MNTPFTDTATVVVHFGGKALPVVPASVSQMLERRLARFVSSQDVAWDVIKNANWQSQIIEWQAAARNWQENFYVQKELPISYTPGKPQPTEANPKTLPEALDLIAELRQQHHEFEIRFRNAEKVLEELEEVIATFENEAYTRTIRKN